MVCNINILIYTGHIYYSSYICGQTERDRGKEEGREREKEMEGRERERERVLICKSNLLSCPEIYSRNYD
jgi:hypothetical protein